MKNKFEIKLLKGTKWIGHDCPCFIVAELSANHGQDIEKAKQIIIDAAASGADAIKLQTYTPNTMTINSSEKHFLVEGENGPDKWKSKTLFELYSEGYTPWEWHKELKQLAEEKGLVFFSTPFDSTSVDFLEELQVPLYKIASYELTDIPLLRKVGRTGKPVLISSGFGTFDEIKEAHSTLVEEGVKDIAILHCVTNYSKTPCLENTNLSTMTEIGKKFNTITGFSDNTGGIDVPLQAAIMGASIIEKHIMQRNDTNALDSKFSLSPQEFKKMVQKIRRAETLSGSPTFGPQNNNEKYFQRFRRSIIASKNIRKGDVLDHHNLRVIRPANGLEPKYFEEVQNKKATTNIKVGTPLTWELVG